MKKFLALLLSLSMCVATIAFGACGDGSSSSSSMGGDSSVSDSSVDSAGESDSSSTPAELTKADYVEAFTAAQTAMESTGGNTQATGLTSMQQAQIVGYHGLGIKDADLSESTALLGVLNALVFNYFFVSILENPNFVLSDEPIVYAAEEAGVATGYLQTMYNGECLVGQMYMQPKGCPAPGLFSIYINYDFETNEMVGFEWLLRGVDNNGTMYYYHDGEKGYLANHSSTSMGIVTEYLDGKITAYTHPTDGTNAVNVVTEWMATNEYANNFMR